MNSTCSRLSVEIADVLRVDSIFEGCTGCDLHGSGKNHEGTPEWVSNACGGFTQVPQLYSASSPKRRHLRECTELAARPLQEATRPNTSVETVRQA